MMRETHKRVVYKLLHMREKCQRKNKRLVLHLLPKTTPKPDWAFFPMCFSLGKKKHTAERERDAYIPYGYCMNNLLKLHYTVSHIGSHT